MRTHLEKIRRTRRAAVETWIDSLERDKTLFARLLSVGGAAMFATGCNGAAAPQIGPVLPPMIAAAMKAAFSDDGTIHMVRKQGHFLVTPDTLFCDAEIDSGEKFAAWPYGRFGIDGPLLSEALKTLSQSQNRRGRPRQRTSVDQECQKEEGSIHYSGQLFNNRSSRPYKLILAMWQGDPERGGALWIAGVERMHGNIPGMLVSIDGPSSSKDRASAIERGYYLKSYIIEDVRRISKLAVTKLIKENPDE